MNPFEPSNSTVREVATGRPSAVVTAIWWLLPFLLPIFLALLQRFGILGQSLGDTVFNERFLFLISYLLPAAEIFVEI